MNVVLSPSAAKYLRKMNEPLDINDDPVIETDLTDEEKEIVRAGREAYAAGGYIPLAEI